AYSFSGLPPGNYQLDFTAPPGMVFTPADLGGDDATDSDPDASGNVGVTVTSGNDDDSVDAGLYSPVEISGEVWTDLNRDGIQDGAELGLGGVPVDLVGAGPDGTFGTVDDLAASTVTAPDGSYSFSTVPPGSYQVLYTPPGTFVFSPNGVGSDPAVDSDPAPTSGTTSVILLASGDTATDIDAGVYSITPPDIGGTVWDDLNGNGLQDAGEPGIDGVTVNLYDSTNLATVVATTTTDAAGWYEFAGIDNLPDYVVEVVPPSAALGFSPMGAGSNGALDSDVDPATGHTAPIAVSAGASYYSSGDAGLMFPVSIGDRLWYDINADGNPASGEPGLGGVTIELLDESGTVIATTTTVHPTFLGDPAAGTFVFEGLEPGAYTLRVVTSTLPAGLTLATFDRDGLLDGESTLTLVSGQTVGDADFAYTGIGAIGDTVWHDINGNGVQDPDGSGVMEPGISGVTITVVWYGPDDVPGTPDDVSYPVQVTDVDGKYLFANLPFGTYSVEVGSASDYILAGPSGVEVALSLGANAKGELLSVDFPFAVLAATAESLPVTGMDSAKLAMGAAILLIVGVVFVALPGRRRREGD
ncbi:MAG: hypothetical protein OEM22_03610, partial [Acidimicrobiia bacterium]|nr:hypothetical protein [Acidimicrobiia bacterium]